MATKKKKRVVSDDQKSAMAERRAQSQSRGSYERAFVANAKPYGERRGISYQAWRQLGVPASVLRQAGISRSFT
jgi:hypothetical protein